MALPRKSLNELISFIFGKARKERNFRNRRQVNTSCSFLFLPVKKKAVVERPGTYVQAESKPRVSGKPL